MLEERDIILREHDYRIVEDPYAPLHDDLMRRLDGDGPFARSTLGRPEDIASFSLAEARAFHRETHRPENSVLIVRGDVSGEELRRILRDKFGPGRPAADTRPPEYAMGPPVRDIRTREAPGLVRPELLYRKVVELPGTGPQSASGLPELRQRLVLLREVLLSSLPGSLRQTAPVRRLHRREFRARHPSGRSAVPGARIRRLARSGCFPGYAPAEVREGHHCDCRARHSSRDVRASPAALARQARGAPRSAGIRLSRGRAGDRAQDRGAAARAVRIS